MWWKNRDLKEKGRVKKNWWRKLKTRANKTARREIKTRGNENKRIPALDVIRDAWIKNLRLWKA